MASKNKNPYKKNYAKIFDLIRKKQVVTFAEVVAWATDALKDAKGNPLTASKARASVTVVLSPRSPERMGNFSAMGHLYRMEELKRTKGESKRFRLRWYKTPLTPHVRPDREDTKVKSVKKRKATTKATTKAKATPAEVTAEATAEATA